MLCSGTTIGTRQAMLEYLDIMHSEMKTWMNSTICCCFETNSDDQAMHNYLYYSGAFDNVTGGVHAIVNRMGLVHTVGAQASMLLKAKVRSKIKGRLAQGENIETARSKAPRDNYELSINETTAAVEQRHVNNNWLGLHYGLTDTKGYFVDLGHGGSNSQRSFIVHQYDRFGHSYRNWIRQNEDKLYL